MKYLSTFIMLVLAVLAGCGEGTIDTSELCPNGLYYIDGECTCLNGKNIYGGTCSNPFDVNNPFTDGDDSVVDGDSDTEVDGGVDGDYVDTDSTDGDKVETDAVESDIIIPTGLTWLSIPSGSFQMGCSPNDEYCSSNEKPRHLVSVSAFEMTETEVTYLQYVDFLNFNGNSCAGPSHECVESYGGCLSESGGFWSANLDYMNHPVINVTWYGAKSFCEFLGGRLPNEAEWEYAARAGTTTIYYCGDDSSCLDDIAWTFNNSDGNTHPVGEKNPNAFGLYDMLGNAWEWTEDCWHDNYDGAPGSGTAWAGGDCSARALRGGGNSNFLMVLSASSRNERVTYSTYGDFGFRCARD